MYKRQIIKEAPRAAPAETPIRPGSARGFLNRPCKDAPESPRLAPTKAAKNTLGILISKRTILSRESELLNNALIEKSKLPNVIELKNITISDINRRVITPA